MNPQSMTELDVKNVMTHKQWRKSQRISKHHQLLFSQVTEEFMLILWNVLQSVSLFPSLMLCLLPILQCHSYFLDQLLS
jgi:hypothetical protein